MARDKKKGAKGEKGKTSIFELLKPYKGTVILLVIFTLVGNGANLIIPIDLLKPVLDDLRMYGKRNAPPRPWLGFLVQEVSHHLVVSGIYDECPAESAGLQVGDVIREVDGDPVSGLANLFRRIWQSGEAGVDIPLTIMRNREPMSITVRSIDRHSCLKSASIH